MLSRVAENVYWLARYLERTENVARLVDVTARVILDLPRQLDPGWQSLITITGEGELFASQGHSGDEISVVRFIVADQTNPSSMLTSISRAREIARTARDILPREVWEQINSLYWHVSEHAAEACGRQTRYDFLVQVIRRTQSLTGAFEGIFNEGEALSFIALGRNLERADMTSRIVDVRAATMLVQYAERLRPYETLLWMNVLRSLSGYQMYRLKTRERIHGAGVVRFLLADDQFPRACVCCLRRVEDVLRQLPNNDSLRRRVRRMRRALHRTRFEQLEQGPLQQFIDRLQQSLGRTSDELARQYFLGTAGPAEGELTVARSV